jgi:hypothetical protein
MKNGVEWIKNNYTYVRTTPSNERADASHHHEQRNTVDSAVSHAHNNRNFKLLTMFNAARLSATVSELYLY